MDRAIERRHLLGSEIFDTISYVCVNPYEVNPVSENSDLPTATLLADIPLKAESSVSPRNPSAIDGGAFYGPQRRIKLEMEEFGDLSPFVSRKRTASNSIDELNTPIFDKDAFDFDISNYQTNVQADCHVMLKYDAFYRENNSFNHQEDIFLNPENLHRNAIATNNQHSDATIYSSSVSENGTYIEKMSPDTSIVFDFDMNNSVSVNSSSRHSSYPSSPNGSNVPVAVVTPEGSERSYRSSTSSRPRLSLDVGVKNHPDVLDVNTPSIIAEVVSLESTGFNILDYMSDDDLSIVNDDVFPSASTSTHYQSLETKTIAVKQPRKKRQTEDDDEDYIPPTKKHSRHAATNSSRSSIQDNSDSESEEEKPVRRKARGRPPKRAESISSDCSKDSDAFRYRELRDKNNEASRKSRQKKKIKEVELETEADALHNKNIKLKAQVEELEKLVNNFRDNLFKIMINK